MRQCAHRSLGALVALVLVVGAAPDAGAYEFEIRARTIGQGAELTSLRYGLGSQGLAVRRYTTVLSLDIWDLPGRLARMKLHDPHPTGARVYLSSYLRVDHDFGDWTSGQILVGGRRVDAVDLIPELEQRSLNLEMLWAYVAAEGLVGGRVDLRVGRLLEVDSLDWWSIDGASLRVATPLRVAVEGVAGLQVRDDSPLGSSVQELDGVSGAACAEYVEGATPGSGSWRPIDRDVIGGDDQFDSALGLCPQRRELMPTWGVALATADLAPLWARLSYRRTMSKTADDIRPRDEVEFEDFGIYPNEHGQAPPWGVNQELVAATARYNLVFARGKGQVAPYLAARYSLLHGLVDEGHAGARVRWGSHGVEPEVYYSFPTFDGDSLFNVFSVEPYVDYRLTYDLRPRRASWRGYVRGWLRQFQTEDADAAVPGEVVDATSVAGGGQLGARYRASRDLNGRLDLFHEDGWGGRRTGGYLAGRWRARETLQLGARLSLVDLDQDLADGDQRMDGLSFGGQLGATYVINVDGVAVHLIVEETNNRIVPGQFRVIGVLDLAFVPEV